MYVVAPNVYHIERFLQFYANFLPTLRNTDFFLNPKKRDKSRLSRHLLARYLSERGRPQISLSSRFPIHNLIEQWLKADNQLVEANY